MGRHKSQSGFTPLEMQKSYDKAQESHKSLTGFTIIEVVLVLAIAGLIFLMVFVAFPAAQRGQRDSQRTASLLKIKTALGAYTISNTGSIPTTASALSSFQKNYLVPASEYSDPQAGEYSFKYNTAADTTLPDQGQIVYGNGRICGTDGAFAKGNTRDYALQIALEGQKVPYCLDSN